MADLDQEFRRFQGKFKLELGKFKFECGQWSNSGLNLVNSGLNLVKSRFDFRPVLFCPDGVLYFLLVSRRSIELLSIQL